MPTTGLGIAHGRRVWSGHGTPSGQLSDRYWRPRSIRRTVIVPPASSRLGMSPLPSACRETVETVSPLWAANSLSRESRRIAEPVMAPSMSSGRDEPPVEGRAGASNDDLAAGLVLAFEALRSDMTGQIVARRSDMREDHRESNNDEGAAAEHHGGRGGDLEQHRVDEPGGGEGQDEARGQTRGDPPPPLCAHVADDAAPRGAEGQPDSELAPTADDSLRHRAENAGADEHEPADGEAGPSPAAGNAGRRRSPRGHRRAPARCWREAAGRGPARTPAPRRGRGDCRLRRTRPRCVRRRELPVPEAGDETGVDVEPEDPRVGDDPDRVLHGAVRDGSPAEAPVGRIRALSTLSGSASSARAGAARPTAIWTSLEIP